jgi:hypothetical protein
MILLANSGCMLVAVGAGAAAGGAGYAYYKGKHCREYAASYADVWAATQSALTDLGMPVESAAQDSSEATVLSRTADGSPVRISVEPQASRVPAEGMATRVCVRVATFGDAGFSQRLLDQIGFHLVPATLVGPPDPTAPVPPGANGSPPTAPVPGQTAPPPLLPPEPLPANPLSSGK